jgi:apolipoprotein N-acyltransferase
MWFLSFIPDAFLNAVILSVLGTGIALYIFGLFINLYPPAYPYREPLKILATVMIVAGVYGYGSYDNEMSWRKRVEDVENQVVAAQMASDQINSQLEQERNRKTLVIHDTKTKIKEKIKTQVVAIDKDCVLSPVVPQIHNEAAKNPFHGAK